MAPLFQYLRFRKVLLCWLFLLALFASSFFDFSPSVSDTQQQPQVHITRFLLGRRNLLEKAVDDDEEEVVVLPKKKKVIKTNIDDDEEELLLPKKNKKSTSSNDDDDEELIPKKKKSSSSDEEILAKKKKSTSSDEDDDVLPKKKKKSSSSDEEEDETALSKKKKSSSSSDNDTKLIKPNTTSTKNQTKLLKTSSNSSSSTKNQTKLIKPIASSSKNKTKLTKTTTSTSKDVDDASTPSLTKTKIKKLNSTSNTSDSTKSTSTTSTKKSLDLLKTTNNKSDTKKSTDKSEKTATTKKKAPPSPRSWMYQDDEYDLISEFRDLPSKFHQSFIPDLHRISTTSKVYLAKANKEITKGFKPYVGSKYAASVATAVSFAFLVVPLLLVSLIFNRIKAYFSLQRLLIFIQIYLAIYFSILCLSSLITGLEPLRFFYATSQSTYVWLQVLQTLGYVLYLLLLLMYLVLVFSTESGLGQKLLGLAQTFVGFAIGLHYYMKVFHRVVLRQPPKTNWKVHGIYAACFLVICLLARAERRKKAYLEEGGEEGKKN